MLATTTNCLFKCIDTACITPWPNPVHNLDPAFQTAFPQLFAAYNLALKPFIFLSFLFFSRRHPKTTNTTPPQRFVPGTAHRPQAHTPRRCQDQHRQRSQQHLHYPPSPSPTPSCPPSGSSPQRYLRIWKDMQGYVRICKDIFWELGYEWISYPRKGIQPRHPKISFHIHVYPCIYSCKISIFISAKVTQCISCISSFIQVQYAYWYPTMISWLHPNIHLYPI